MKKENIYVVIDSKKKQERAIEILQKAGEEVNLKGDDMYFDLYRYFKLSTSSGYWYISCVIGDRTQITLDELEKLLTKKKKVRYRIKTQEEFEATCKKTINGHYKVGQVYFFTGMHHLFGVKLTKKEAKQILSNDSASLDLKHGNKDNDNYRIFTKEMITPIIEQPKEETYKTDSQVNPTVMLNDNGKEYELVSYAQGNELLSKKDVSLANFETVEILNESKHEKTKETFVHAIGRCKEVAYLLVLKTK